MATLTNSPSLLLFDLGGVLTESSAYEDLNRLLPKALDSITIKERWLASTAVRHFERGETSPDEFAEQFVAEWGIPLAPKAFLKEFASWPKGFFPGARETICELRKTYQVACLSNSNALHCERFRDLEEDFDVTLFSHQLGVTKPDREAFMLALHECRVDPSEVRFFDDCAANIRTARDVGVQAFHVEGFEAVLQALRAQGLL